MHFIGCVSLLFALVYCSISVASQQVVDYEALPSDTIFPGPWESNIRAPLNKSRIVPIKIFNFEGAVSGQESVLRDDATSGISWVIRTGGLITFEFEENISGRYVPALSLQA
jgi:hypothetical protein